MKSQHLSFPDASDHNHCYLSEPTAPMGYAQIPISRARGLKISSYIYRLKLLRLINFDTLRRFPTLIPQSRLQVVDQSGEVGERGSSLSELEADR
jgi:hypothetical protein